MKLSVDEDLHGYKGGWQWRGKPIILHTGWKSINTCLYHVSQSLVKIMTLLYIASISSSCAKYCEV